MHVQFPAVHLGAELVPQHRRDGEDMGVHHHIPGSDEFFLATLGIPCYNVSMCVLTFTSLNYYLT